MPLQVLIIGHNNNVGINVTFWKIKINGGISISNVLVLNEI